MPELTTIEVPQALRDAVVRSARAEGLSVESLLQLVMDEYARARRFAEVRQAYAGRTGRDDEGITEAWDVAVGDGLGDA